MRRRLLCLSAIVTIGVSASQMAALPPSAAAAEGSTFYDAVAFGVADSLKLAPLTAPGSVGTVATYGNSQITGITASPDGYRLGFVVLSPGAGNQLRNQAVVADVGGRLVRVLDVRALTVPASDAEHPSGAVVSSPVLSPDGNTAVWSVTNLDLGSSALRRVVLPSGSTQNVAGGATITPVGFADASTLLGLDVAGTLVTLPLGGGTAQAVRSAPLATAASVSPRGDRVALVTGDTGGVLSSMALVHEQDGTWSLGTPVVLTTDLATDDAPQFSHDGTQVFWAQDLSGRVGSARLDSDLYVAPAAGGTPQALLDTPDVDEVSPVGTAVSTVTPQPPTLLPMSFTRDSATVRWALPSDESGANVVIERTGGGSSRSLITGGTSYTDLGLTAGSTYTYSLRTVGRSGPWSDTASRQVTTVAPVGTFADPTSSRSVSPAFELSLPAGSTYSVQYRANGAGALQPWLDHASGARQVFTAARAGSSYGFLMTTHDSFGNSSVPAGLGVAVVPYDQNRASYAGSFVTESKPDRYLGSATILRTAGSTARFAFSGNRVQVIGEKCGTCGVLDVYLDGVRVAGIDTHDAQRRPRSVLWTRLVRAGSHTLVVRARGTSGRPNVILDGFGVRH